MKTLYKNILFSVGILALWSCEDNIEVELPQSDPVVVIDAWINNKPEAQKIKVLRTIPYFENTFLPGLSDAVVQVTDLTDNVVYSFEKVDDDGNYVWEPTAGRPNLGQVGNEFKLVVQVGNGIYEAFSTMYLVP